jgi:CHAD domain-containing protein
VEIEAKYTVAHPAVFATLLELGAVDGYALLPAGERHLVDHYLDTAQRDLLRAGYSCRLREIEGGERWVVTVKELARAEGGVHRREEHECEIARYGPPGEWPDGPAREVVSRLAKDQALAELLALRQHRVLRAVERDGRAVGELSLDTIEIDVDGRQTAMHEVEIELAGDGTLDDLRAIGAGLGTFKLEPQPASKFERALAILDGPRGAAPRKKKKLPGVRADEPLAEAGRKILRFHYERMRASEAGTLEGQDVEALHRMRVATRRQRAAFRIIAPQFRRKAIDAFRDELKTAAERLGGVRDLDVLIEAAERHQASLGPADARSFTPVLDDWRGRRRVARDELVAYLNADDYRSFTESYGAFLSTPGAGVKDVDPGDPPRPQLVRHLLPAAVWEHYGNVRAYETVLGWASLETIHALRIEGKRLRYLLEFFSEVLGPGPALAIEALVALQDHIGDLHDAEVAMGLLREFLIRGTRASIDPAVASAAKRYLGVEQARLRALERTLTRPWRRVTSPRFRVLLARALAAL